MGTWRVGPTHPGLYSDLHGHSFSPGPFHTLRGPRSLSSWWAPSGILAHSQLHLDLVSFLIESLDVEEPLFIPSLDCVMFYLNVFIIVMFCLPGFLEPESKYIREKSSLTVVSVQIFRPLSHGCFEITFSQLTLHDFWGKERIFFAVLQLFKLTIHHFIGLYEVSAQTWGSFVKAQVKLEAPIRVGTLTHPRLMQLCCVGAGQEAHLWGLTLALRLSSPVHP